MHINLNISLLTSLLNALSASATHATAVQASDLPLSVETIYDFGLGGWVENIAVRSNGSVLACLISAPQIWQINPFEQQSGNLIHTFEGVTSVLNVVETSDDVFHVIVGNFSTSPTFAGDAGSFAIWELDLTSQSPAVSHVVDVPTAVGLDGMALLNKEKGLLLAGDAMSGPVYLINTKTKTATEVFDDAAFAPTSSTPVGLDGMKIVDGVLYFTNMAQGTYGRVSVDSNTGKNTSAVEVLLTPGTLDDITMDSEGDVYFTLSTSGLAVLPKGASNYTLLAELNGPATSAFGRTSSDTSSIYVGTTGGDFVYPTKAFVNPGTLSRVNLTNC